MDATFGRCRRAEFVNSVGYSRGGPTISVLVSLPGCSIWAAAAFVPVDPAARCQPNHLLRESSCPGVVSPGLQLSRFGGNSVELMQHRYRFAYRLSQLFGL